MGTPKSVTLDVRSALAAGQEPFGLIMGAVEPLTEAGDELVLIAPFEPVPLYRVLGAQGFEHEMTQRDDGSFEVRFRRR